MASALKIKCPTLHVPTIHGASHVDHKNRVAWFSISNHACGYGALLGGPTDCQSCAL